MIVQFHVANFRSFEAEESFSFVANKRLTGEHDDHTVALPNSDERLLRAGVLYGANGAGKSNLFRALHFLQLLAQSTKRSGGTGRIPFRFRGGQGKATELEVLFVVREKVLRYGVVLDDERIMEEWLIEVLGGRERVVFERTSDSEGKTEIEGKGLAECGPKVALMAKIGGKQNQTFLASLKSLLAREEILGAVGLALDWFESGLVMISPDSSFGPLGSVLYEDADLRRFAGDFLRETSTGVERIEVRRKKIGAAEFERQLNRGERRALEAEEAVDGDFIVSRHDGLELVKEKDAFFEQEVLANHRSVDGEEVTLRLQDESDGTKKLLDLVPALFDLKQRAAVYVIDEIDRSLHPLMVRHFVASFLKACQGGQRQLLVTTHESRLLDLGLLRRDEIWFAEKDQTMATRLYSLSDYKVRKDHRIDKQYLQGRFGAIPLVASLEDLAAEAEPIA